MLVQIRNAEQKKDVVLNTVISYSLNSEKTVHSTKLSLQPGEIRDLKIPVKLPEDAKFGIAIRTEMLDESGRMIDCGKEFFSVSDFVPRDLSFGITNANLLYNEGMAEVQNSGFKRRYVGAYEYYCWAKSVIGALAPEDDEWIPNTEHSMDKVLTKKMVKKLVADAHSKGVGVYSWITGLWDYHYAFRYPERLQYNKDGQPNIYGGNVYPDGRRRADGPAEGRDL